ncbi:MAG TPA: M20/M25/M40 family metallo-hydrolase [Candidatus Acidoferrales bacterium]|nr:M20/M25/M40 family metallo-hydrolase [Candidatus Acidoferrales bacterium]
MRHRFTWIILTLAWAVVVSADARAQMPSAKPDLARLADEAQVWLSDLVRINSVNPPGNEAAVAKYISAIFQKEGIPNEVIDMAPGRSIVVARLQAGPLADPANALLLVAHQDTVGVDPKKWSVDPFGAVVRDGYLWGRGSIDDKAMLTANIATMVELKRSGARLGRDVLFLATDDEEQSGAASIKMTIQKYWDKIACAYALNEGGRVMLKDNKVQYVGVQASEKVAYNVTVSATGLSGHASMPRPESAIVHLATAIEKLGAYQVPAQPNTITRRYFEQLSKIEDDEIGKWMRALETPERADLAVKHLSELSPMWNSMLRDTIAPTMLQAGVRVNIIPSEATANLNVRMLPGHSIDELIGQFAKVVNDPQIRFQLGPDPDENSPPSDITSALFQTIERLTPQDFPGAITVPLMGTGATDSASLRLHKVQALGLNPFPLTEADALRVHGDEERIPIDSFHKGVIFLYHVVSEFASSK